MKHTYGQIKSCKHCGQDIQYHGKSGWLDRGGNRSCCTYIKDGEVVKPKTKHKVV